MNVVAEWSILESRINSVFANLMGANAIQTSAIFSTIRSTQGQRDAFAAVIDTALPEQEQRDIISAYLCICEKASKLRNRIAHWVWGHSTALPNAVLLADPTAMAAHSAKVAEFLSGGIRPANAAAPELDYTRIFAYTAADFKEASDRIQQAINLEWDIMDCLRYRGSEGAPELLQLSSVPEIRAELERLNKGRQKHP